MNIGSLYRVKKWHWLLFPSKESVSTAADIADALAAHSINALFVLSADAPDARYYSTKFKENVTYFSPDSVVVLLEEDGNLKKVLTSEGLIGWTWFVNRYNDWFEEVNQP